MDPEVQALADRIAAVRTAIENEKRARAEIEETQLRAPEDETETLLETLRGEVTAARAKLAKLQRQTPVKVAGPRMVAGESSERSSLYYSGALVSLPGLITVSAILHDRIAHPEAEALDPMMVAVFAIPLVVGLVMLGRARFAKYSAKRDALGWDFLG